MIPFSALLIDHNMEYKKENEYPFHLNKDNAEYLSN